MKAGSVVEKISGKQCDAYQNEQFVILRQEDEGGGGL